MTFFFPPNCSWSAKQVISQTEKLKNANANKLEIFLVLQVFQPPLHEHPGLAKSH